MKLNITRWLMATVVATAATGVSAQNLQSAYFDDNYLYRFQSNPAFGNEGTGFVAMPGLGNLNIGTNGTIGLNQIFYNVNGETTTLLNPNISASEALGGMKDHSRLGVDLRETILAFGFKAFKGYNTISVSARTSASIGLPKEIVRMAKEGLSNDTYDLSNLGGTGRAWAEVALNHSHQINKQLRVGATLKVLVGVASFDARVNTANFHLNQDNYIGEVDAEMHASIKNFAWQTDYNDRTRRNYVNGADLDGFSPINGMGAAIDLGAVYTLNKDWEFSLAFTDLGFINWKNDVVATTNGLQSVETDSFSFNVDNNDSWDKFRDNLSMLYELEDKGDMGSRTTGIGATMTAGAQYSLPVYRRLKFGLMNTTRINGDFSWTEFRLSANIEPVKILSAGVNVGMGTFGASFGGIVNLKAPGFNLFVATDCMPGKLAKQGVPLNSNLNVNLGINFPF
ncbi:MAG: hypothetical protein K2G21_07855 [Muribaculaceae bacterium]|nr:hypothetical protein [Muribaculaceae bacterium]